MSEIDLQAIRDRQEARRSGPSEYSCVYDCDADIDTLLTEVERLRVALHALNPRSSTIYGSEPDNPYTYGVDILTPEESDRIKASFDTEEEG